MLLSSPSDPWRSDIQLVLTVKNKKKEGKWENSYFKYLMGKYKPKMKIIDYVYMCVKYILNIDSDPCIKDLHSK